LFDWTAREGVVSIDPERQARRIGGQLCHVDVAQRIEIGLEGRAFLPQGGMIHPASRAYVAGKKAAQSALINLAGLGTAALAKTRRACRSKGLGILPLRVNLHSLPKGYAILDFG
jgi:hypothetical protein